PPSAQPLPYTPLFRSHGIEVFNLPGAGGTVGLSRLVGEHGNGKLAMSMGLGVVGAVRSNDAPRTLADTTPIARLTEEQDVVVVRSEEHTSELQSRENL